MNRHQGHRTFTIWLWEMDTVLRCVTVPAQADGQVCVKETTLGYGSSLSSNCCAKWYGICNVVKCFLLKFVKYNQIKLEFLLMCVTYTDLACLPIMFSRSDGLFQQDNASTPMVHRWQEISRYSINPKAQQI